jgi:hypothetical protein
VIVMDGRPVDLTRARGEAALVLGDAERVGAALAADPGAASRELGPHGWEPLLYVAYSAFLGGERTDGLVACAEALLRAGADPDAAWEDAEYDVMTALHGAAGLAHDPRLTALSPSTDCWASRVAPRPLVPPAAAPRVTRPGVALAGGAVKRWHSVDP